MKTGMWTDTIFITSALRLYLQNKMYDMENN